MAVRTESDNIAELKRVRPLTMVEQHWSSQKRIDLNAFRNPSSDYSRRSDTDAEVQTW